MAELLNPDTSTDHTLTLDVSAQKTPRCRFGQSRAPKRCIVEHKRAPHRMRRNQRGDSMKSDVAVSGKNNQNSATCKEKNISGHRRVSHPEPSPPSSPDSAPLSPTDQPGVLKEHKRPRPEHQVAHQECLSSSAPACLRDSTSTVVFGQFRPMSSDRPREFECDRSLLDVERLQYLLSKEPHYHPNNAFLYYVNPEVEDKVDAALRNEAVHNLRFMHNAIFNLSAETFCKAVNLIDRFIVKVKVKPKYMACVATASYCVASKLCTATNKDRDELPALDSLVHITRCGGNAADLLRMEEILASKLSHDLDGINTCDFLQTFISTIVESSNEAGDHERISTHVAMDSASPSENKIDANRKKDNNSSRMQRTQLVKRLMNRLEISLCSLEVYRFRPVCLALGILAHAGVKGLGPLAALCGVEWSDVIHAATSVEELYELYYRDPLPCNRRSLVWNLSRRTLFRIGYSSPTPLDTITEDCEPAEEEEWLLPLLFEP